MFLKTEEDLGIIGASTKNILKFQADPSISNVEIIPPSCDCTRPEWDEKNHEVSITYVPANIRPNIMKMGNTQYNAVRQVCVHFDYDGIRRTQFLTIRATVLGKL